MIWVILWCPEEDVILLRLLLFCRGLGPSLDSEVVPKAVHWGLQKQQDNQSTNLNTGQRI
jgi:hypothetical protein